MLVVLLILVPTVSRAAVPSRSHRIGVDGSLGFGPILVSEIEAPNMFVNLVWWGRPVVQSNNATEPAACRSMACKKKHQD